MEAKFKKGDIVDMEWADDLPFPASDLIGGIIIEVDTEGCSPDQPYIEPIYLVKLHNGETIDACEEELTRV